MTQDFAKKQAAKGKKKSRPQSNVPAWVWVFTGVVTGAFIMFLVYLAGLTPKSGGGSSTTGTTTQNSSTDNQRDKPVFEFYDRLLDNEVVVNIDEEELNDAKNPTIYILQAASFQQYQEADALKALLTLEGLDVEIQEFSNKGETWHRVLVGPFDSRSKMAKARSTLAQHDISPILLKKEPDA